MLKIDLKIDTQYPTHFDLTHQKLKTPKIKTNMFLPYLLLTWLWLCTGLECNILQLLLHLRLTEGEQTKVHKI